MKVGDRVMHNYPFGHGVGTIVEVHDIEDPRRPRTFEFEVQFDSGYKGPYNRGEVVPVKQYKRKHRPLPGIMGKGHGHKTKKEKDSDWRSELN